MLPAPPTWDRQHLPSLWNILVVHLEGQNLAWFPLNSSRESFPGAFIAVRGKGRPWQGTGGKCVKAELFRVDLKIGFMEARCVIFRTF